MEIQALTLIVTEDDLNELLRRHLYDELPIEELEIRLSAEGLCLKGIMPLFLDIKFETWWSVGVQEGKVLARLVQFKALGMPGGVFKSAILKLLDDTVKNEDWLRRHEEGLLLDFDNWLLANGLPLKTNLSAVICQERHLLIEARVGP